MFNNAIAHNQKIFKQLSKLTLCFCFAIGSLGFFSAAYATDVEFTISNENPFTIEFDAQDIGDEFYIDFTNSLAGPTYLEKLILRWDQVSIDTTNITPYVDYIAYPNGSANLTSETGSDYYLLDVDFSSNIGSKIGTASAGLALDWYNFNPNNDFTITVCTNSSTCAAPVTNPVPVPAAAWLFGTGIMGLIGFSRRKISG